MSRQRKPGRQRRQLLVLILQRVRAGLVQDRHKTVHKLHRPLSFGVEIHTRHVGMIPNVRQWFAAAESIATSHSRGGSPHTSLACVHTWIHARQLVICRALAPPRKLRMCQSTLRQLD